MVVKLNKNQFDYLNNSFSEQRPYLESKLQIRKKGHFILIEVDENIANKIRDWAGKELQKKGFDLNYELTSKGKILEELIDVFYIK